MEKARLTASVLVRLTAAELAQIEAKAASEDRSISNCLRQLVKAGIAVGSQQPHAA